MKSWVKILLGLILGLIVGLVLGPKASVFHIFGKAFINLMTMLLGLIVFSSVVVGICHIRDPKRLGRIGFRTIAFYFSTTIIAASVAIILSKIIKPGEGLSLISSAVNVNMKQASMSEFLLSLIPANPFASFSNGNVLQIIVFSIFLGIAILFTYEKAKPLVKFFESITHTMHTLTHFIMQLAPYGVFALMASTVGNIGFKVIVPLIKFLLCNYAACFIQLIIVYGFALKYLARVKVSNFFKGMKDAIVMAFTTSSSAATLPVSLECTRKHLGISQDISGFVLSLGSTINANGGAIGQAVSAIFIAQAYGIELGIFKMITLIFVALLSSLGASGVPGTGLIMMSLVLSVMGLPLEGIGLLAGVDRLREMLSSVVNIVGDAVAATVIAKSEGEMNQSIYEAATWSDSDI
ncbi:MAG TPA: dicarboxylate/amino acid:cation symporter [Chlamydiales bacterium]|nr:dicarboxylate/amino acid:cation symporter [Chlamydiales bacterium]